MPDPKQEPAEQPLSAPESLQEKILERTWAALRAEGLDEKLIDSLVDLAGKGRISHATHVRTAIEESVPVEDP